MAKITQVIHVEGSKDAAKAFQDLHKENIRLREEAQKLSKEGRAWQSDFKKGMADISRFAKQTAEEGATAADRYREKVRMLNAAVATGKLTQEQATQAAGRFRRELEQQNSIFNNAPKWAQGLMAVGASYLSIHGALRLVNAELERKKRLEGEAETTQLSHADAQRELLLNVGTATKAEREQLLTGIRDISTRRGVSELKLLQAGPGVTSAQGKQSVGKVLGAMDVAAQASPRNTETLKAIASGLLDVSLATKSEDAMENFGFMLGIGRGTRVQSLADINENLVPAVVGLTQKGDTPQQAAAIVSTLTSLGIDPTGRKARTASIDLAESLEKFLPAENRYEYDTMGRRKLAAKGTGMTSTTERVEALQRDAKLRERFLGSNTFEAAMTPAIRNLLTGGSEGDVIAEQRAREIQMGAGARQTAQDFFSGVLDMPLQQTAAMAERGQSTHERWLADNTPAGREALIRKEFQRFMDEKGINAVNQAALWAGYWLTPGSGVNYVENQVGYELDVRNQMRPRGPFVNPNPDAFDKTTIALQEMLATLREIRDNQTGGGPPAVGVHEER